MNPEAAIRDAELMQLLLLESLYALSGSEHVVFQGGTAIRWIHGGMRFSEDLDFVTRLPSDTVQGLLLRLQSKIRTACIAQFGPGMLEQTPKGKRPDAVKTFFILRP
ncbi:MAG: nucleotidyl transferase AbiEii/AbiGii toxin family protein, partial [Desulfobacterota bacterium]|nr:nucleotidyl transferase AbiEii/AbiGii toxin family protein [Thermodesulfobacteriota bacterium]